MQIYVNTQSHQPESLRNEIPLPYYLQQLEITKNQITNFTQIPNTAESLQLTIKPYLRGGSSIKSKKKTFLVFTRTDPEYSIEDY